MAEDKRIRVSADTTPLQEVRQAAKELWDDLAQMENNFKQMNEGVLQTIQKQIDLLKERNSLYTTPTSERQQNVRPNADPSNIGIIDPYTGRRVTARQTIDNLTQPRRQENENNRVYIPHFEKTQSTLDRIYYAINKISETLEQGQRHEDNNPSGGEGGAGLPTPNAPGAGQGGKKPGFQMPTSLSGAMKLMPYGMVAYAAANAIGGAFVADAQYDLRQYSAPDRFRRANQTHWLMQKIPWIGKIQEAENEQKNIGLEALDKFNEPLKDYQALNNFGYEKGIANAMSQMFDPAAYTSLSKRIRDEKAAKIAEIPVSMRPAEAGAAGINSYRVGTPDQANANNENFANKEIKAALEAEEAAKGINKFEVRNWASETLGMSATDYLKEYNGLAKSAVYASNTGEMNDSSSSANQLLLAGRLRGLSTSDASEVLASTRFDRTTMATNGERAGMTGANVVQAFDTNLQQQGKTDQYIVATLSEYLSQFNRVTQEVLSKTGSIDTEKIVGSMTSIQNTTGMEGSQLARVQDALMGGNVSQDDTTQALLMRTARELNPDGNYSDLMEDMENMRQKPELQNAFLKKIYTMTGGGEAFRTTAKSIFPGMSWSDINAVDKVIESGGTEEEMTAGIDKIFKSGTTKGGEYLDTNAKERVSPAERSKAETENRHIIDGATEMARQQGKSMEDIMLKLRSEPLPVTVSPAVLEKLKGIEDAILKIARSFGFPPSFNFKKQ